MSASIRTFDEFLWWENIFLEGSQVISCRSITTHHEHLPISTLGLAYSQFLATFPDNLRKVTCFRLGNQAYWNHNPLLHYTNCSRHHLCQFLVQKPWTHFLRRWCCRGEGDHLVLFVWPRLRRSRARALDHLRAGAWWAARSLLWVSRASLPNVSIYPFTNI